MTTWNGLAKGSSTACRMIGCEIVVVGEEETPDTAVVVAVAIYTRVCPIHIRYQVSLFRSGRDGCWLVWSPARFGNPLHFEYTSRDGRV